MSSNESCSMSVCQPNTSLFASRDSSTRTRALSRNWDSAESKAKWRSRRKSRMQTKNWRSWWFCTAPQCQDQDGLVWLLAAKPLLTSDQEHACMDVAVPGCAFLTRFIYASSSNMLWILCESLRKGRADHNKSLAKGREGEWVSELVVP